MKMNPYIHFAGDAEDALNFYQKCLGGEIITMQRYGDSPMPCDDDYKNKIMHARLLFGEENLLMVSDVFKGQPVSTEGNIQLAIGMNEPEEMKVVFNKMAEGGEISMPLAEQFWGALFGMLKDKFGVSWMFNCELKK